jgi:hypothetical protein
MPNASAGNVSTLITSGFDAFANLYDIVITWPTKLDSTSLSAMTVPLTSVRALDFTPPELSVSRYPVPYKGAEITRLGSKIEGDRTFSLTFRIDSNYYLYTLLRSWKHAWSDPSNDGEITFGSYSAAATSDYDGTIVVRGYTSSSTLSSIADPTTSSSLGAVWTFNQVLCTKTGTPGYVRSGGSEALTVTADFIFGTYSED